MAYGPPRWSRSKVAALEPVAHRRLVLAWELEGPATPFLAARRHHDFRERGDKRDVGGFSEGVSEVDYII